jgi:hypothetical protein
VRNRDDVEANQVAAKADPHQVLAEIDEVTQVHMAEAPLTPKDDPIGKTADK